MNWLKVAAVAIGALLVFLVVGSVVHLIMTLLGYLLVAALVAGGGYVAYKIVTSGGRRELRRGRGRRSERRQVRQDYAEPDPGFGVPPTEPRPAAGNVDDDLTRLKREMGH
jgi:hypothetical protein